MLQYNIIMIPIIFDPQQYHDHFEDKLEQLCTGPIQGKNRTCTDKIFLLVFIVIMGAGIALSVIMILNGDIFFSYMYRVQTLQLIAFGFASHSQLVLSLMGMSVVICLIFTNILLFIPRHFPYFMVFLVIALCIATFIFSLSKESHWMVGMTIFFLVLTVLMMLCYRKRFGRGLKAFRIVRVFLKAKPGLILMPFFSFIVGGLFLGFWIVSFLSTTFILQEKQTKAIDNSFETFVMVYLVFFLAFMHYFLYNIASFIIGTAASQWYYGNKRCFCLSGLGTAFRYHLGSITHGALVMIGVNLVRRFAQQEYRQQFRGCRIFLGFFAFLVSKCCYCIYDLLNFLNHNSIFTMVITGQPYMDCAKSACSIMYSNFPMLYVVDFASDIVQYCGVMFATIGSTMTGFTILIYLYQETSLAHMDPLELEFIATTLAIFLMSLPLASWTMSMVGQAYCSVFYFYCLSRKLITKRFNPMCCPIQITNLRQLDGNQRYLQNQVAFTEFSEQNEMRDRGQMFE